MCSFYLQKSTDALPRMDWDHWRFFPAVAYSDDLRRHRFIHCVGDLLASLLYPHRLNAHARRSQNRAPHSGRVALFKRRGARTARGMDEVRVCKAGVIKVWMMGRCFVWDFLGVPNFFSEGGREIFL